MTIEMHVAELRGFLNALQRLMSDRRDFYADVISPANGMEAALAAYFNEDPAYQGSAQIGYPEVQALLHEYIFAGLNELSSKVAAELEWQLLEYYGLASTAAGGSFNPLISNGALLLTMRQSHYSKCAYYVVQLPHHLVITGLGILAQPSEAPASAGRP